MELIPSKSWFTPDEDVAIEADGAPPSATVRLVHVASVVAEVPATPAVRFPNPGRGGYGVELWADGALVASTAVDVLGDAFERPRYGFVAAMTGAVDVAAVARFARRLHLTLSQFYDWGYRHSELLPPDEHYLDPLGQERELSTVNELGTALQQFGTLPLGYAAVYAIGHAERADWEDALLLRADGEPYRLGDDFLLLVDPAHPRWLDHFTGMLGRALDGTAFAGFHLDQYGWPKFAVRGDGARVDVARSFVTLIERVHRDVPNARAMFNNVNDFPTPWTAGAAQDATYIEVWPPHSTLQDLGELASRSRALRPEHPPILSAYLSVYEKDTPERADAAAALTMAAIFSHGATHLLLGEAGHALTDAYYPKNHVLPATSIDLFARWYDFLVRHGDLLFDVDLDMTEYLTGGINSDVVFDLPDGVRQSTKAEPGALWTRVVRTPHGIVIHFVNLAAQSEVAWDAGKAPTAPIVGAAMNFTTPSGVPRVFWASPDEDGGAFRAVPGRLAGGNEQVHSLSAGQSYARYELPTIGTWAIAFIPAEELL